MPEQVGELAELPPGFFVFEADAARARRVEARVRAKLADSIDAVLASLDDGRSDVDAKLIERIRARPVGPAVFGIYTDLVEAIYADDMDGAAVLARELRAFASREIDGLRTVTLTDNDLGAGQPDRYRRFADEDPRFGDALPPLSPAAFRSTAARVADALTLLDQATPELAAEVRALIREIVLVGNPTDGTAGFNGASSFQLWGALFLNADSHPERLDLAEAIVHEAAHALLFGFTLGRSLVRNDDAARYNSPLRSDLRPMDGIVHATFVVARMHYLMRGLRESGQLTVDELERASAVERSYVSRFDEGVGVIDRHAIWTPVGEAAFAGAVRYMAGAPGG